jgi:hypothetical protein
MNRRNVIKSLALASVSLAFGGRNLLSFSAAQDLSDFNKVIEYLKEQSGILNNIGLLIGNAGKYFEGYPYKGGTLENPNEPEKCRVNLTGFDCVTFYETALGLARIIQKKEYSFDDLLMEITHTRYRNGKLEGYTSRLHYTSEWIYDNVKKNVITDITKSLGGTEKKFKLDFMSSHPQYYPMLKGNKKEIEKMSKIEEHISDISFYTIPHNNVEEIESELQTGDIIALTSSVAGLDYAHTGLIYRNEGVSHFLHASSEAKEVKLDTSISKYISRVGKKQSITVARPLNV